jgi:hypothetical protein
LYAYLLCADGVALAIPPAKLMISDLDIAANLFRSAGNTTKLIIHLDVAWNYCLAARPENASEGQAKILIEGASADSFHSPERSNVAPRVQSDP